MVFENPSLQIVDRYIRKYFGVKWYIGFISLLEDIGIDYTIWIITYIYPNLKPSFYDNYAVSIGELIEDWLGSLSDEVLQGL